MQRPRLWVTTGEPTHAESAPALSATPTPLRRRASYRPPPDPRIPSRKASPRVDPRPPAALVVVAVGAALRLLHRSAQLVGGVRHRSVGRRLFAVDAGGVPAAVRPRSRTDGRRSGVSRHHGRRRRRAVPRRQLAQAAEQRRSVLSRRCSRRSSRPKHSITIEAYIYWAGEIGLQFAQRARRRGAARRRASRFCSMPSARRASATRSCRSSKTAAATLAWYNPIRWYTLRRINNRTHRKSLIIDGRIGFTGGAGIADHWTGDAQDDKHWRDMQIRIEGPAVRPLQTGFAQNWLEMHRRARHRPGFLSAADAGRTARRCRRS